MFPPPKPRILIADDECVIANILAMILNQNGYEAIPVYGGRMALDKASHWSPDLFLSDVDMPALNGIEAAIEIRATLPDRGILLFSGDPGSGMLVHEGSFQGHRFALIYKPIPPLDLLDRIRHLAAA
jgi:CheY-like chemotaxis protein